MTKEKAEKLNYIFGFSDHLHNYVESVILKS